MRPFDEVDVAKALPADRLRMWEFNKHLSGVCIASEHAFGLLKGRFPSLKEMGRHEDIQDLYKAMEAMMIIHNICMDWKDRPDYIWDFDPTDDWSDDEDEDEVQGEDVGCEVIDGEAHVPDHETNAWLMEVGRE